MPFVGIGTLSEKWRKQGLLHPNAFNDKVSRHYKIRKVLRGLDRTANPVRVADANGEGLVPHGKQMRWKWETNAHSSEIDRVRKLVCDRFPGSQWEKADGHAKGPIRAATRRKRNRETSDGSRATKRPNAAVAKKGTGAPAMPMSPTSAEEGAPSPPLPQQGTRCLPHQLNDVENKLAEILGEDPQHDGSVLKRVKRIELKLYGETRAEVGSVFVRAEALLDEL